jgi:hypothetical protein
MTASITNLPSYAINRVEFLVDSKVACSDNTPPFVCDWRSPAAKLQNGVKNFPGSWGKER